MTKTSIRGIFLSVLLLAGTAMVPADSVPAFETLGIGAMPACAQEGGDDDCTLEDDIYQCLDCLECLLSGPWLGMPIGLLGVRFAGLLPRTIRQAASIGSAVVADCNGGRLQGVDCTWACPAYCSRLSTMVGTSSWSSSQ